MVVGVSFTLVIGPAIGNWRFSVFSNSPTRPAGGSDGPARHETERAPIILAAVHTESRLQEAASALLWRQGHVFLGARRAQDHRWLFGLVLCQRRTWARADREGDPGGG